MRLGVSLLLTVALLCYIAQSQPIIETPPGSAPSCPKVRIDWSLAMQGGSGDPTLWADSCDDSLTADFYVRDLLPEYYGEAPCFTNTWGPDPIVFPTTVAPGDCGRTNWHRKRFMRALDSILGKGYNFCHHHIPRWVPPNDTKASYPYMYTYYRVPLDPCTIGQPIVHHVIIPNSPDNITASWPGTCSSAGLEGPSPWSGLDASTLVAWALNYAFGIRVTGNLGDQACGPNAPGLSLTYNTSQLSEFLPGDLLYIANNKSVNPLQISHVAIWTGFQVSNDDDGPFSVHTLLRNVPSCMREEVSRDIARRQADGLPTYVIIDSHFAGPNFRPFAGWWLDAFSHARRVVDPDPGFPRYIDGLSYSKSKGCLRDKFPRKKRRTWVAPPNVRFARKPNVRSLHP